MAGDTTAASATRSVAELVRAVAGGARPRFLFFWGHQLARSGVLDAAVAKFASDPALRDYLVGTRRRVLVEASPVDRIWGIGLAAEAERVASPAQWRGLNLLGFALMEARERLG